MNSFDEMRFFFEASSNDGRISSTHIGVFAALLQYRHEHGGCNPIEAFSAQILPLAKISAARTYHKIVKQLSDYGYLRYEPSYKKNRGSKIYFKNRPESP